jgi:molybdopterin synthase catalytic subunit
VEPNDCLVAVADPAAGGVGVFIGTVRDDDNGRSVRELSYEAHPSAAAILEAICEQHCGNEVLAVAAEHRLGDLAIGDVAVVVAVSAVHRAEALDTARRLIDTIKTEVPIWKHQSFRDGTEEWVGLGEAGGCRS